MAEVIVTPLARQDVKDIGRYTQKNWGVNQRNFYLGSLDKTMMGLLDNRIMDRKRDHIQPGLLSCSCQQHMIFFRRDDAGDVVVLRVLGQAMDFERHL